MECVLFKFSYCVVQSVFCMCGTKIVIPGQNFINLWYKIKIPEIFFMNLWYKK